MMSARRLLAAGVLAAAMGGAGHAAPPSRPWPECRAIKPGVSFEQASTRLGGRGRRSAFTVVDDLSVATYAFRRALRTCRVQFEEGMVLATPILQ